MSKNICQFKKSEEKQEIEKNLNLVFFVYNKWFLKYWQLKDDLIGAGNLGLVKAMRCFKVSIGVKFSTFVTLMIKYEMLNFLNKEKKYFSSVSLNELDMMIESKMDSELWELYVPKCLKGMDAEILTLLDEGYTYREIGRKLGVTTTAVWKRIKNMRVVIKEAGE